MAAPLPDLHELWVRLNRPGADRFRQALLKRGINASAKDLRELFLKYQSSKQIFAPGPKYLGKITSTGLDAKWMADVVTYAQASEHEGKSWNSFLAVQDVFSRKAWAVLIESPSDAFAGYHQILREAGKAPEELVTDGGPEFQTPQFKELLRGTRHTVAVGRNDMATLDRFIGVIKRALAEHTAETGEQDWASRLPEAVHGFNENGAPALYGSAPDDLRGPNGQVQNKVLAFERQWDESHFMVHNAELIKQHADKLNDEGSFRTYIRKDRLGRRIFDPHWTKETRTVGTIRGGFVRDLDGNEFPTKEVLPVPLD